jgi:hypothetical protein
MGAKLIGGNMNHTLTKEQYDHMRENIWEFQKLYEPKYTSGQQKHSGNMWKMGAYQALENAEEEALDNWSYLMQIRKTLDEIQSLCTDGSTKGMWDNVACSEIVEILNRRKQDG